MAQDEYRDLSDKIDGVKDALTGQMTAVLVRMGEVVGKLDSIGEIKRDLEAVKELSRDAMNSTRSAHNRLDDVVKEATPLVQANLVDRVKSIESTVKWAGTTIIGTMLAGAIGLLFFFAKGGP